jgi:hypothetical protein
MKYKNNTRRSYPYSPKYPFLILDSERVVVYLNNSFNKTSMSEKEQREVKYAKLYWLLDTLRSSESSTIVGLKPNSRKKAEGFTGNPVLVKRECFKELHMVDFVKFSSNHQDTDEWEWDTDLLEGSFDILTFKLPFYDFGDYFWTGVYTIGGK